MCVQMFTNWYKMIRSERTTLDKVETAYVCTDVYELV